MSSARRRAGGIVQRETAPVHEEISPPGSGAERKSKVNEGKITWGFSNLMAAFIGITFCMRDRIVLTEHEATQSSHCSADRGGLSSRRLRRVKSGSQNQNRFRVSKPQWPIFSNGRRRIMELAPSTAEQYRYSSFALLSFFGDKQLDKITSEEVERYKTSRAAGVQDSAR